MRLLRDIDQVFNNVLPRLRCDLTANYALCQVLECLRDSRLTVLLQRGYGIDHLCHRGANDTVS